jgi:hypothetical protein
MPADELADAGKNENADLWRRVYLQCITEIYELGYKSSFLGLI